LSHVPDVDLLGLHVDSFCSTSHVLLEQVDGDSAIEIGRCVHRSLRHGTSIKATSAAHNRQYGRWI
jgi:hypothetical protein